jgi:diamine N-acetyltransferase
MIELRKITDENFRDCMELDPGKGKDKFVAPNKISLAQAFVALDNDTCTPMPFAIYAEEELVGFIQLAYYRPDQETLFHQAAYDVWRFMIDEKHQGKGYGKAALKRAIDYVKTWPKGHAKNLYLSYVPGNAAAEHVYESLGFVQTGDLHEGEIMMTYDLQT